MKFLVIPFDPSHYEAIAPTAFPWMTDPSRVARQMYEAGPAFTALLEDRIVACAGLLIPWPGLGQAWAVVTPEAAKHPMALHRAVRRILADLVVGERLIRVEASVQADSVVNRRWAEALGFQAEVEMKRWGPDGATFVRMIRFPLPPIRGGYGADIAAVSFLAAESAATVAGTSAATTAAAAASVTAAEAAAATTAATASAVAYASAAATVAGSATSAYSAYASGQAQDAASRYNAKIAAQNAEAAKQAAEAEATNREKRYRLLKGSQRSRIGASGVISTEGSPLLVQMDSEDEAALDVARVRYAGAVGSTTYSQEAALQGFYGQQARRAGTVGAGTSLLQGVTSAASVYARR